MTEPSDAAIEEALRLNPDVGYKPAGVRAAASCDRLARSILAHAKTLQEVDRVARVVEEWLDKVPCQSGHKSARALLDSLMLPDPVDPDEELAREVARQFADAPHYSAKNVATEAIKMFRERLRADGRLTDAIAREEPR